MSNKDRSRKCTDIGHNFLTWQDTVEISKAHINKISYERIIHNLPN